MKTDKSFEESILYVCQQDTRYHPDAYRFLLQALRKAQKKLKRKDGHVTSLELLESFRSLALEEFGPMAYTVVEYWGITKSDDVGNLVFNLIEAGAFCKTENDSLEQFHNIFDFKTALTEPFLPSSKNRAVA